MWLFLWGRGAWNVAQIACGEACPVAVAAVKVFAAAGVTFTLVLILGVVPLMGRQVRVAGAATDVKAPAPKSFAMSEGGAA